MKDKRKPGQSQLDYLWDTFNIYSVSNKLKEEEANEYIPTQELLINSLQSLDNKSVKRSEMGVANGVATLDTDGKVPASQLPSYVDDIIDVYATYSKSDTGVLSNITLYLDAAHTQLVTGEAGKIYQNIADGEPQYQFRWTGTIFSQTGASSLILGEVTGTAYDGAKGKANADKLENLNSKLVVVDEEDVTAVDGKIKFKDRNTTNGMGYKVLRLPENGILTQDMINQANTIYEIRYNFDLNGATITIPENCTLKFEGGSMTNGTIVGEDLGIISNNYCIFKNSLKLQGSIKNHFFVDWVCSDSDLSFLYSSNILQCKVPKIVFSNKKYITTVRDHTVSQGYISCNNVIFEGNGCTISTEDNTNTIGNLLIFKECKNVIIRNFVLDGGISGEVSMSEGGRHNLSIHGNCHNIIISNIETYGALTDGIYIAGLYDGTLSNIYSHDNGRQGCSIVDGSNIVIEQSEFSNSYLNSPKGGIDIEPNTSNSTIDKIVIRDCVIQENKGTGIIVNLSKLSDESIKHNVNISIDTCVIKGNNAGISLYSTPNSGSGVIIIYNSKILDSKYAGISIQYACDSTPIIKIFNNLIRNCALSGTTDVREASLIAIHDISSTPINSSIGNVEITNCILLQEAQYVNVIKRGITLNNSTKGFKNIIIRGNKIDTGKPTLNNYTPNISLDQKSAKDINNNISIELEGVGIINTSVTQGLDLYQTYYIDNQSVTSLKNAIPTYLGCHIIAPNGAKRISSDTLTYRCNNQQYDPNDIIYGDIFVSKEGYIEFTGKALRGESEIPSFWKIIR